MGPAVSLEYRLLPVGRELPLFPFEQPSTGSLFPGVPDYSALDYCSQMDPLSDRTTHIEAVMASWYCSGKQPSNC